MFPRSFRFCPPFLNSLIISLICEIFTKGLLNPNKKYTCIHRIPKQHEDGKANSVDPDQSNLGLQSVCRDLAVPLFRTIIV